MFREYFPNKHHQFSALRECISFYLFSFLREGNKLLFCLHMPKWFSINRCENNDFILLSLLVKIFKFRVDFIKKILIYKKISALCCFSQKENFTSSISIKMCTFLKNNIFANFFPFVIHQKKEIEVRKRSWKDWWLFAFSSCWWSINLENKELFSFSLFLFPDVKNMSLKVNTHLSIPLKRLKFPKGFGLKNHKNRKYVESIKGKFK